MSGATERPWIMHHGYDGAWALYEDKLVGARKIGECLNDDGASEANAALIVKAVNCHDDLVAALKAQDELMMKGLFNAEDGEIERCDQLRREALAKAEAGQ